MNHKNNYGTPLDSKVASSNSKSLFHDFIRPMGQLTSKHASSPFRSSPQHDQIDFIPLGYSSPINNKGNGGHWKENNRRSLVGSPSNSSNTSTYSPYNVNRSIRNSPGNSSRSPSFVSGSGSNKSGKYCGYRQRDNRSGSDNVKLYYHPSMLDDPWAELERNMQSSNSKSELNSSIGLIKSASNISSIDSSDSDEADSQETDSAVSASEGYS